VELNAHRDHHTQFSHQCLFHPGSHSGNWPALQDQWRITDGLTIGVRATSFIGESGTRSEQIRGSLIAALDDNTRLYGSLTAINQFIIYRNTGVFFSIRVSTQQPLR
jgi:hypothetical protein